MTAFDRVTEALHAHGCAQKGKDWVCPSHDDSSPSLSVSEGATGVVMKCHAGCTNEQIVDKLGLTMADLFDKPITPTTRTKVATYAYQDEQGDLLYEVIRYEPKDFRQRTPVGEGRWDWKLNGVRRVPYCLPQLLAAVARKQRVWICEGEKDVDALFARGEVATCNSGGAGRWRDEFATHFVGAEVIVVADKDAVGAAHAKDVVASLESVASSVTVVQAKEGKDATDHFRAGFNPDEFIPFQFGLETDGENDGENDVLDRVETNTVRSHLLSYSAVKSIPPPVYLVHDLIVADSLFCIYGRPGSMKSFLALDWGLSMAHGKPDWHGREVQPGSVLYVVGEGLSGIGQRVIAWEQARGATGDGMLDWVTAPVNLLDPKAVDDLLAVADDMQPMMVVFDTLARCMPGADENAPGPMSAAIEAMDAIRRVTKAAVGCVHHTPKDGSTPRGHSNLEGAVQSAIKVVNDEGAIKVSVEKQKDGDGISTDLRLRKVADSAVLYPAARSEETGSVMSEIELLKVMHEMVGPEGASMGTLIELSGLSKATVYRATRALQIRGKLTNIGTLRSVRFALSDPTP